MGFKQVSADLTKPRLDPKWILVGIALMALLAIMWVAAQWLANKVITVGTGAVQNAGILGSSSSNGFGEVL